MLSVVLSGATLVVVLVELVALVVNGRRIERRREATLQQLSRLERV